MDKKKNSFLESFYYQIIKEGRRRELSEQKGIPYTPKTDWELVEAIFEQEGWEDIIGDDVE